MDAVGSGDSMDVIADLAYPLPAIVTAELLGVPSSDRDQLKAWSEDFAEMLGNFQHNPDRVPQVLRSLDEMTTYFRAAVRRDRDQPGEGLIHALASAENDGDRLSEEEVIANTIVTMVGGQETTTNLIGNGLLALLRHPDEMKRLRADPSLVPSAVEELLRYESPSQHTARMAPNDLELGGKLIRRRQAVIAVMGAANRDPDRFPRPGPARHPSGRQPPCRIRLGCPLLLWRPAGADGRPAGVRGAAPAISQLEAAAGSGDLAPEPRPSRPDRLAGDLLTA